MVRSEWTRAPNPDENPSKLVSTVGYDANPSEPRSNS